MNGNDVPELTVLKGLISTDTDHACRTENVLVCSTVLYSTAEEARVHGFKMINSVIIWFLSELVAIRS